MDEILEDCLLYEAEAYAQHVPADEEDNEFKNWIDECENDEHAYEKWTTGTQQGIIEYVKKHTPEKQPERRRKMQANLIIK